MPLLKGYIQPFEVKDIDGKTGLFTQAYTRYNVLDSDKDRGRKGMFTKSWRENQSRIRHLLNHDERKALGEPQKFWEDDDYAYMQSKIAEHNDGKDFIKMVEGNLIKEASYGYTVIKSNKLKDGSTEILEVKLWEVSSLTGWGANEYTPVIELKGMDKVGLVKDYLDRYEALTKFCYNSTATDSTLEQLEIEKKQIHTFLIDLYQRTEAATEALQPQGEEKAMEELDTASVLAFIEIQKQLLTA